MASQYNKSTLANGQLKTEWFENIVGNLQQIVYDALQKELVLHKTGDLWEFENNTAIAIVDGVLAIAKERNLDGTWNFRTFGTGDGFTADEINAGTLRAVQININDKTKVDSDGKLTGIDVDLTGKITISSGSSGISNLTDAGNLATADNLDDVANGTTYKKTTENQVTGAGRAYNSINEFNDIISRVTPTSTMGNPSVQGLYMASDYIGFHNGNGASSGWLAYIKNNGQFKFKGNDTNFVEWTGTELNVRGKLNASDITTGTLTASFIDTSGLGSEKIYKPNHPTNYGVIGGAYCDLELYQNNSKFFTIYNDSLTSVAFKYGSSNTTFLNSDGTTSYTYGVWDFTQSTSVNGLETDIYGSHNHGIANGTKLAVVDANLNITGYVEFVQSGSHWHYVKKGTGT
jgi:hypothetical protein